MDGLRRLARSSCLAALVLTACGTKDLPPPPGSLTATDPAAAAAYAQAQATDQAGDTRKATKLYDKVATKYPYSKVAPEARFRQGTLLEHRGELLDSFDAYQQFIDRYQSSPLYMKALSNQAIVAHAAADGIIKSSFLGIKSRLDSKKTVEMLTKVRANAPQASSAPKAQFAIGQLWENRKRRDDAIAAYQLVVDDYPSSALAPEAQYRIGSILLGNTTRGNQNQANLDKARFAFEDLIQRYPNSSRASDARQRVSEIGSRDIQRSYDVAEFYYKKGQTTSAAFYYEEVLRKASSGALHDKATARLATIQGQ